MTLTNQVKTRLNELAQLALEILDSSNDKSLPFAVQTICSVMTNAGIVAAHDIDYYNVENSFIHLALKGRPSLPITMAVIFSGIAWRCGIAAAPINYVRSTYSSGISHGLSPAMFLWQFHLPRLLRPQIPFSWMFSTRGRYCPTKNYIIPWTASAPSEQPKHGLHRLSR